MAELIVIAPGAQTTVQDRGRPGYASMGVSESGAFDRGAYETGRRLLWNPLGAAALEVVLGGLTVRASAATKGVVTGGFAPVMIGDRTLGYAEVFELEPGDELRVGYCTRGIRLYVSFGGGIEVPTVLGSRSADTLSGLGPAALRAGDVLPLGDATPSDPAESALPIPPSGGTVTLDVLPGPRTGWLIDPELAGEWTVSPSSNRVGVRLSGAVVGLNRTGELPSEGVVRGAIQVPPGGQPVIFGPDHPTTGGYPVVGVLTDASCDALAQLRPGQRVRLGPRENGIRPMRDGEGP